MSDVVVIAAPPHSLCRVGRCELCHRRAVLRTTLIHLRQLGADIDTTASDVPWSSSFSRSIPSTALAPFIVIILVASAVLAVVRRDPRILAPVAVLGGALGFDMLALLDNAIQDTFPIHDPFVFP